jgi:8-oxo-dGTP pyrophosphatase MutT (NUDIX family)
MEKEKESVDASTRKSMRVILLNEQNEVLLLKVDDPHVAERDGVNRGPHWFLVGGAIEEGETPEEAVLREIYEETGIEKDKIVLGPIVWRGELDLMFYGKPVRLKQRYMVAKTSDAKVSFALLTPQEKEVILEARWFSLAEIIASSDLIYPRCLKDYLPAIISGDYPRDQIEIPSEEE